MSSATTLSSLTSDAAMDQILARLGATPSTLTPAQSAALSEQGFLLLPGHMPVALLEGLRAAHDRLMAEKYPDAGGCPLGWVGHGWHHEAGTRRLVDLTSEDPAFDATYTDSVVLAAVAELFAHPFRLDTINAREPVPGQGQQGLHRDRPPRADGVQPGVNTAWLLDDFTAASGPTRVVPGSHRWPQGPDSLADASAPHPGELAIIAPAGSVMVFANTLWHGGTRNLGPRGRRVVHVSYCRREDDLGERAHHLRIRKSVWERISPEARAILVV